MTTEVSVEQSTKIPAFLEDGKYSLILAILILGSAIGWSIYHGKTSWQQKTALEKTVANQSETSK